MKDLKKAFMSWYVIDGGEHLKINSFDDALIIMNERSKREGNKHLIMMSDKEYLTYKDRKTKRGKKS